MCPTQASLIILCQADHIITLLDISAAEYPESPLDKWLQITDIQVANFLHHVAHKVFLIPKDHQDLCAWSCHSIQVTVANLLHRAQFLDSYIKNWLQWCSDTLLVYLLNTFYTTTQHTGAITLAWIHPQGI